MTSSAPHRRLPWLSTFGLLAIASLCLVGVGGLPDPEGSLADWWLASSVEFSILLSSTVASELIVGTAAGWLAAYGPRGLHAFLQRTSELIGALPLFVYLAVLRLATGGEPFNAFVAVVCIGRTLVAADRTRSVLLELERSGFSEASRALGSSRRQRFSHHFVSHVLSSNLAQTLHVPAFLVGLEACLGLVGAHASWASWGAALVDPAQPLLAPQRLLALASLIATGAWAAGAATAVADVVRNRAARVGRPDGASASVSVATTEIPGQSG